MLQNGITEYCKKAGRRKGFMNVSACVSCHSAYALHTSLSSSNIPALPGMTALSQHCHCDDCQKDRATQGRRKGTFASIYDVVKSLSSPNIFATHFPEPDILNCHSTPCVAAVSLLFPAEQDPRSAIFAHFAFTFSMFGNCCLE